MKKYIAALFVIVKKKPTLWMYINKKMVEQIMMYLY